MKKIVPILILLCVYAPAFSQKNPASDADVQAILKKTQRMLDSMAQDPKMKKMMKDAKALNIDSVNRSARDISARSLQKKPDTTTYKLRPKDTRSLGALPSQTLSDNALKKYISDMAKVLIPAIHAAYGTPIIDISSYPPIKVSYASVLAMEMGDLDEATIMCLQALVGDPTDAIILNNSGAILEKGGLDVVAIPVLQSALGKQPGSSTVENNLGQSYLHLGERDKARNYLQQCVSHSPTHPLANNSLALLDMENGAKDAAIRHVENSLRGAFTDLGYHLLYKLKQDPTLMDYFENRYQQPIYFDENKYPLPKQCDRVEYIGGLRGEYRAYHEMLDKLKRQFDTLSTHEMKLGIDEMRDQSNHHKPSDRGYHYEAPFMELANAMLFDAKRKMEKSGADEIARAQKRYHTRIDELQKEYAQQISQVHTCDGSIDLANAYMGKMSVETHEYQKVYMRIWIDFYHDNVYWGFFTSNNKHVQKATFCKLTSGLFSVLSQLAETHFLDVGMDCNDGKEKKKEATEVEVEEKCPLEGVPFFNSGVEIPFGIGKYTLNCEGQDFQIGEILVLNVSHNFHTGETIWALGPGVSVPLLGGKEAIQPIPGIGPQVALYDHHMVAGIQPGLEVGIKGQAALVFKDGALTDFRGIFSTEIDILGWGKELKSGYSIGVNSDLQMEEGGLKRLIDKEFGPPPEAKQVDKRVKMYKN